MDTTVRRDVKRLVNDKKTGLPFDLKEDRALVARWLTGVLGGDEITRSELLEASTLALDPCYGLPMDWSDLDVATVATWLSWAAEAL